MGLGYMGLGQFGTVRMQANASKGSKDRSVGFALLGVVGSWGLDF